MIVAATLLTASWISMPVGSEPPAGPGLGRQVSPEEIAHSDVTVFPDGAGLPPGRGDARAGETVYRRDCLACHGPDGLGGSAEPLAGAQRGLTDEYPEKTVGSYWPFATTLFDFNRRTMPPHAPGSLTGDEAYAVTAYLLFLNGIVEENQVLDAAALARLRMPNRDGFVPVDARP